LKGICKKSSVYLNLIFMELVFNKSHTETHSHFLYRNYCTIIINK
jgi:hypothetical protein